MSDEQNEPAGLMEKLDPPDSYYEHDDAKCASDPCTWCGGDLPDASMPKVVAVTPQKEIPPGLTHHPDDAEAFDAAMDSLVPKRGG